MKVCSNCSSYTIYLPQFNMQPFACFIEPIKTIWTQFRDVCIFTAVMWIDAPRLGASATLSDPSRPDSYQQPLWKHHPRWWRVHRFSASWSQVCDSHGQTTGIAHTRSYTHLSRTLWVSTWELSSSSPGSWCLLSLCVWKEEWLTRFAWSSLAIKMPTVSSTEEPSLSSSSTLWDQFWVQAFNIWTNSSIYFTRWHPNFSRHWTSRLKIALMPRHSSMEMFNAGDAASNIRKQTYERYRCHEGAKSVIRPQMSDTCAKLISSMSAVVNDGALREWTRFIKLFVPALWSLDELLTKPTEWVLLLFTFNLD